VTYRLYRTAERTIQIRIMVGGRLGRDRPNVGIDGKTFDEIVEGVRWELITMGVLPNIGELQANVREVLA
jgi:hypothetical protein